MNVFSLSPSVTLARRVSVIGFLLAVAGYASAATPEVPDWALPGSATHKQVPPPKDFHRPTVTVDQAIGIFEGQSDVGGPLIPGSSSYDAAKKAYTLNSASYNIWYSRDEFRYVWKKMSGNVSLAADITFPNAEGYNDRKVVLIIRQDLEDDSKEAMVALHGAGLVHLAQRPEKNADIKEAGRIDATKEAAKLSGPATNKPIRLGLEKNGDVFALYVSLKGEPMHQIGTTTTLHLDAPFYVGIGFCSHVPDKSDTGVASNVVLENAAGKIQ
jgi:hypothetical protein